MSATPDLVLLESAAREAALAGNRVTADALRDLRLRLADLLDAADDKCAELDYRSHGLTDTAADRALRRALSAMRPMS